MPEYTPTTKSAAIEALLTDMTGKERPSAIRNNECVTHVMFQTLGPVNMTFKTALDEKEYTISGMCQSCQDFAFAPTVEEDN